MVQQTLQIHERDFTVIDKKMIFSVVGPLVPYADFVFQNLVSELLRESGLTRCSAPASR